MKYNVILLLSVLIFAGISCKKSPEDHGDPSALIQHQTINKIVSYQNPVILSIEPNKVAFSFTTMVVMNNNILHLVFKAGGDTQSGNKILLSNESLQPLNINWASSLTANTIIDNNTNRWSNTQESGLLIAIAHVENDYTFKGTWAAKSKQYLGISLRKNDGIHYGWVCISHIADKQELQIHDWAYSKVAGKAIKAGER